MSFLPFALNIFFRPLLSSVLPSLAHQLLISYHMKHFFSVHWPFLIQLSDKNRFLHLLVVLSIHLN